MELHTVTTYLRFVIGHGYLYGHLTSQFLIPADAVPIDTDNAKYVWTQTVYTQNYLLAVMSCLQYVLITRGIKLLINQM